MTDILQGRIFKAVSGSYEVKPYKQSTEKNDLIISKARGIFRKNEISPLVGDIVEFELLENGEGIINAILPRKNSFRRPPLANLDQIIYVVSTAEPPPNTLVIDKLLAISEYKGIDSAIIITKLDIDDSDETQRIYTGAGIKVIKAMDTRQVLDLIKDKTSAFSGNSGVGKSTLINKLFPHLNLQTAQISRKLGRGKHTTRHVELFELEIGGYLADTPGFSSVDTLQYDIIYKEDLQYCFKEFIPYINDCKFTGCSHTVEKGCGVLKALDGGLIQSSRHNSYLTMYEESRNYNKWELEKN